MTLFDFKLLSSNLRQCDDASEQNLMFGFATYDIQREIRRSAELVSVVNLIPLFSCFCIESIVFSRLDMYILQIKRGQHQLLYQAL